MTERIDNLTWDKDLTEIPEKSEPFFNGPGEFLCLAVATELKKVAQFKEIFGD